MYACMHPYVAVSRIILMTIASGNLPTFPFFLIFILICIHSPPLLHSFHWKFCQVFLFPQQFLLSDTDFQAGEVSDFFDIMTPNWSSSRLQREREREEEEKVFDIMIHIYIERRKSTSFSLSLSLII